MKIKAANRDYERWLKSQLNGEVVAADLKTKHARMTESAFAFLRATYWRWAETILTVCPDAADAPAVLAVGDIHLENFGTWTDDEGRICWGVNDYDEAAEMPYILDLIRLAVSAALSPAPQRLSLRTVCLHVLDGYREGLAAPQACVLDRDHLWLRARLVVDEAARSKFWNKIEKQHGKRLAKRKPELPEQPGSSCSPTRCPSRRSSWSIGGAPPAPAASGGRAGSATAPGAAGRCCARARRWCLPAGCARMAARRAHG